jgi:sigma-54 dependent transcriptional regulator, acetoin dehydrogenase operon transcriptional activator AcoR
LPTGAAARLYYNQVRVGSELAGVVVHVKLSEAEEPSSGTRENAWRTLLPGLVGHAPLWLRACHAVEEAFQAGEWLVVEGEPGVGKLALLRSVQLRKQPSVRFTVLDAADATTDTNWLRTVRDTLSGGADSVVVRHVDRLDSAGLRGLSAALRAARAVERAGSLWVSVTLSRSGDYNDLASLLRHFPCSVEVPALRLHLEDMQQLVAFFLARLGHGGKVTCSPEAMRLLMRSPWPGNVEQLRQVLQGVLQRRRAGIIQPADLPPETQTISRRVLSSLESMERDAIVLSLADALGNKVKAAQALGMSRATIYRKIHEWIVVPSS